MSLIRPMLLSVFAALALVSTLYGAESASTFTFVSQRKTDQIDRVKVVLKVNGDVLVGSTSGDKPQRQKITLSCDREYDEKTLQLSAASDGAMRGVRDYREAKASFRKGTVQQSPELQADNRLVGIEIAGGKETLFSPKGSLNVEEFELVSAVGDSLPLDQLLPGKPVKIGELWGIPKETVALLLGLEEVTSNSLQMVLNEANDDFAKFEIVGKVEGKLYGADNQISLEAKCRFNRRTGRIDWFAMRLKHSREIGLVENGIDATVLVQIQVAPLESSEKLSDTALAGLSLKPTDELTLLRYRHAKGGFQLTHDRSWFLIDSTSDHDAFHRLDHGQDIGLCKVSPQLQVSVKKLPSLEDFQGIVQKLLGTNLAEVTDISQAETSGHLRILRVKAKGKDNDIPVRWSYYHVSDPEGRQVTFAFRVEEKRLDQFGHADEQLVHSLQFVAKVMKEETKEDAGKENAGKENAEK